MIQKGLYKVGDSPQKGDRRKREKKNNTAIRTVLILYSNHHTQIQPPQTGDSLR